MARANHHYIPAFIWHITHRCHKREFLLRFRKDRHRWTQWLYQDNQSDHGNITGPFWPSRRHPFRCGGSCPCVVLTSQANCLWQYTVAYGVFAGAGLSLLGFSSHAAFLPKWLERKRGLAVGLAMAGIGFGMLVLIPLFDFTQNYTIPFAVFILSLATSAILIWLAAPRQVRRMVKSIDA